MRLEDLANDPVFVAHEGGKVAMVATKALHTREDLALLYTPGVARVSAAIATDPDLADRYTARRNTVAVISDGTAVLGLGDIGPLAAMPVMEGKAVLFKHFAGIDAVALCIETGSVDEIVETIARLAPSFGGINLEDISAPRCFEIEERLVRRLPIPVFHDDQHGTAIVVLAGLLNAARVLQKDLTDMRIVVSGAGAAGVAVTKLLLDVGVRDLVVLDSRGILGPGRPDLSGQKKVLAERTNPRHLAGGVTEALRDAEVFVGVSGGTLSEESLAGMAPSSV
ncbi:NAD(P)-dependent malic enzyme, partial [Nostocoides sp.]